MRGEVRQGWMDAGSEGEKKGNIGSMDAGRDGRTERTNRLYIYTTISKDIYACV